MRTYALIQKNEQISISNRPEQHLNNLSQTFSSQLFIFGNQGRPAGLNVTQLNKAWWNTLLHVWSQDLYVISAHRKNDSTLNIPCLALTQTLAMMLAGLLFIGINKGNRRSRGRYWVCDWLYKSYHTLFLSAQTLAICLTLLLLRRDMFKISASLCVHVSVCTHFRVHMQASPAIGAATVCQVKLVREGTIRPFKDAFFFFFFSLPLIWSQITEGGSTCFIKIQLLQTSWQGSDYFQEQLKNLSFRVTLLYAMHVVVLWIFC